MTMAIEIRVPRLGWNMEEGTFVAWLKKDGETVKVGEPLFTLEGDKAVQDVESTDAGVLRLAPGCPKEGDTVAVGVLLGHLLAPGEPTPSPPPPPQPGAKEAPTPTSTSDRADRPLLVVQVSTAEKPAISPRARRLARQA